ncbi:hypothetical protein VCSRO55_2319 [Vibrio cholerae]|uniref:glycosyltransferase family 39 protein n=1 Tax=Vibrio cholerae TaxID=666 RepID=UPI0011D3A114|nr:glycosyltransferase family 39 protein [Vibrio cholerae]EGR2496924.1 hypothetical protein [Vibrio cholerae]TXZ49449.1 glycosyltransferase family 39 protein [Vibrio cholerae]BCN20831.1 hypothetical protein [Vibrio cholerae]GHW26126.1 hypothetical protein VCSRO55_2319 [Vibrio cholerae]
MYYNIIKNHKLLVLIVFSYFLLGMATLVNYGVSWDEAISRTNGIVSYNYVFNNDDSLETYHDKDYGVAIELPLAIGEKLLDIKSEKDIFLYRHYSIHTLYLISSVFFYFICNFVFKNQTISIIGIILYLCSPVVYTHSFYNTKDVGFLSLYVIATYFSIRYLSSRSYLYLFMSALSIALLINVRILGIQLFIIVAFIDLLINYNKNRIFLSIVRQWLFIVLTLFLLYISWPYLWNNPIDKFISSFSNMAHFRWNFNLLYMGEMILATKIPWHYSIVWFSLSVPIAFLAFGIIGMLYVIKESTTYLFKKIIKFEEDDKNTVKFIALLISLGVFVGSIGTFIALDVVLYDGWRHYFYIYPFFVFL